MLGFACDQVFNALGDQALLAFDFDLVDGDGRSLQQLVNVFVETEAVLFSHEPCVVPIRTERSPHDVGIAEQGERPAGCHGDFDFAEEMGLVQGFVGAFPSGILFDVGEGLGNGTPCLVL